MSIPMTSVESSQIAAIGHDPETNTLAVQFKGKNGPGAVYHYRNFPARKFDAFMAAESKGKFFGENVRGKAEHEYEKVI